MYERKCDISYYQLESTGMKCINNYELPYIRKPHLRKQAGNVIQFFYSFFHPPRNIYLLPLSTTFLWPHLKFIITFFSQLQFLTDLLCSSERNFQDPLDSRHVFILCSYSIFRLTKYFRQSAFGVESGSYFVRIDNKLQFFTSTFNVW